MITTTALTFGTSVFIFLILLFGVKRERRRGERFFLINIRSWFDVKVDSVEHSIVTGWDHFTKYILQLHWYYSLHSVLRAVLRVMITMYTSLERTFEWNRSRAKQLRAEKRHLGTLNHLQQVAEHKEGTALTPAQKRKLRHKKLEERH